jgi:hypothetical protein
MKLVRVTWLDAMAIAEWTKMGDGIEPQRCETVGYVVSENDKHVVVAATISDGEFNAGMLVPRPMIESIVEIKESMP